MDIGGTFTDVVTIDEGTIDTEKTPSTPDDPEAAVLSGLETADEADVAIRESDFLAHGTTVTTNAVLEDELPETALITTDGFRDVLEIGRQDRPDLYDLTFDRTNPIVPRRLRLTVDERIDSAGTVLSKLDEEAVRSTIESLPDSVESVAVSTLFSFENPVHEEAIRQIIESEGDVEYITLSSAVLPEFREYERTSTTVLNAALRPVIEDYVSRLSRKTRDLGIQKDWVVMQSNGGLMSVERAQSRPVTTLLSGPAAGVKGAQFLAESAGVSNVITMDMGGTSTDVSLIEDGEPTKTTDWTIGGRPLRVPAIDIHTIGSGGGSIAWVDEGGALRVGPISAGADPGPAAYGKGGERPTVTDAHVVLGRIHPDFPLGGELSVDVDAARSAIEAHIGGPLDRTVSESALGILKVARSNMERALRVVSVERGYDPRSFVLVAFGGAGPLHATGLAEDLSIPRVMIPRMAGVLSGLGLLTADRKRTFVKSVVEPFSTLEAQTVRNEFEELVEQGNATLRREGVKRENRSLERALDIRYVGQSHSLTVPIGEEEFHESGFEQARERFHREHERTYGHATREEPVELENVRVVATGEIPPIEGGIGGGGSYEEALVGTRPVRFSEAQRKTDILRHEHLPLEASFDGPAIVQADDATSVIRPGQRVEVDERGSLIVQTREGQS
ncbi:MAG: hydantoinase/oxoprolinase family protein [Halodesulfurarchaeum sp.]